MAAQFGFAQGLLLPLGETLGEVLQGGLVVPVQCRRPGAKQHLVEDQLIAGGRRWPAGQCLTQRRGPLTPALDPGGEALCLFAKYGQPGSHILAALVVMGGGCHQPMREVACPPGVGGVELPWRMAEILAAEAYVITRNQRGTAIPS